MNPIIRLFNQKDFESVKEIFDMHWRDSFRTNLTEKLNRYIQNDPSVVSQKFKFFIIEDNKKVVGVGRYT